MKKEAGLALLVSQIFLSLLCFASGKADTLPSSQPTARFVGGTLEISDLGHRIPIPSVSGPPSKVPNPPAVHSVSKRSGGYFVLVTTSEFSRGYPPRGGACGSGTESFIRLLHVVGGIVRESEVGLYESCFDNREKGAANWNGPLFTITTVDLLEDNLRAKKRDEIWQTITYSFDTNHPENGINEDKSAPRATSSPPVPIKTKVSRSNLILLGRATSLTVVDDHSQTIIPEPRSTDTRYSLRLTIKPITLFSTQLKEAPTEFTVTYGKRYVVEIEDERARLLGKDLIYFLSETSNESSSLFLDFTVPAEQENEVRKCIDESK